MSESTGRLAARELPAGDELRRGWKVLAACLVGACLSVNALPFYTLGVFATPIVTEFGWARADYQVAVSLFAGWLLATAPVVGALIDRLGPRRVALVSLGGLALGFVAASRMTPAPWTFYLAWLVIAAPAAASLILLNGGAEFDIVAYLTARYFGRRALRADLRLPVRRDSGGCCHVRARVRARVQRGCRLRRLAASGALHRGHRRPESDERRMSAAPSALQDDLLLRAIAQPLRVNQQ